MKTIIYSFIISIILFISVDAKVKYRHNHNFISINKPDTEWVNENKFIVRKVEVDTVSRIIDTTFKHSKDIILNIDSIPMNNLKFYYPYSGYNKYYIEDSIIKTDTVKFKGE